MTERDGRAAASGLRVDPVLCTGAGYCAELLPELISLDDWGYPIVDGGAIDDPALLRLSARAVARCPRLALMLTSVPEAHPR